ncbi:MAG: transglycosylase domain-containing protein [Clostridiales bacterium]|nr:transglycosylase domain-containing protein [Clostridiales bacterium]
MTKFFKISAIIFLSFLVLFLVLWSTYLVITRDAKLDESKLINPNQVITVLDDYGNEITDATLTGQNKSVKISGLQKHTIDAFIASEDRTFYSHKGLNYKRMLKALYKNTMSRSFKEGASTISQQLIKNTHLSSDKTIKRKLKEIKLTKQLEKKYSKNQILEMYLNTIYFGHNSYGLQSAADFYFDKKAEELTLSESATIVGLLTSPNNFSPFKHPDKCIKRRNTVLKAMRDCKFITKSQYLSSIDEPLNAKKTTENGKNANYLSAVFDEIEENVSVYNLAGGCTVKTYLKPEIQKVIENYGYKCDNAVVVTSREGGVNAYKSTIGNTKRQPGSTIKPLAVYAPAFEEKALSPFTKILDEKVNYGGYSPENYDKKYHGYVTVTDSIKYSYNVPAVKTLNALTLKKAEKYLTKMNLPLDENEKNLSLALGGMTNGLTLKELADRYSIFQKQGTYRPSHFIKEIVSIDGKTIYKPQPAQNRVFSEGTSSLINSTLLETTKSGTAKKLSHFNFDIASKTGTCGNDKGNTDAYSLSYTSEHCIAVWLGDKNNIRRNITGGVDCCEIAENVISSLYTEKKPENLDISSGTETVEIDAEDYYDNNKVIISDPLSPKLNKLTVKVLKGNAPKETSTKFTHPTIPNPSISVTNGTVNIELCQTKYYDYMINRQFNGKNEVIYDGKWKKSIADCPKEGTFIYTVTPYFNNGGNKIFGTEIVLPPVNLSKDNKEPQVKIPDIAKKDWYNL